MTVHEQAEHIEVPHVEVEHQVTEPETAEPGEFSVVRLPSEIDLGNASAVLSGLLTTINRRGPHLVVDARDVRFIDSSGLNALVRALERTESLTGSLHVVAASRRLRKLLEITRLSRVLHRVDSLDEAVRCLRAPSRRHICGVPASA